MNVNLITKCRTVDMIVMFYYPPEVRRGEYLELGVFLLQYFSLVKMREMLHYYCINMHIVG